MRLPEFRRVMTLYWPILVEQVLGIAVGVVATAMVAGLSDESVAGVGLISSLNFVVMNLFIAVSTGATVVSAQCMGRRDLTTAREVARQSLALVTYIGLGVAVTLMLFEKPLLAFLFGNADPVVLAHAQLYMRFSSASMPFLAISSTIAGIMRAVGEVRIPMLGGVVSNAANVIVGAFAIYILHAGVAGAGWGLLASRILPAAMLLWILQRGHGQLSRLKLGLKVSMTALAPVLAVAIPAGVDSLIFNGCKLLVQVFMSSMGTDTLAANAVLSNISAFVTLPASALGTLSVSLAGQAYGSGDMVKTRRVSWRLTFLGCGFTVLAGLIIFAILNPLIGLFSPSDTAYKMIYDCMILFILASPVLWSFSFLTPNCLRATGMARYTMMVSVGSMILLRVFCAWLLGVYLGYGLYGIWVAMFLDWLGRGIFFVTPLAGRRRWKNTNDSI